MCNTRDNKQCSSVIVAAIAVTLSLALLAFTPRDLTADPDISIYTDTTTYASGETIEVSISVEHREAATSVDVYLGLLTWDDELWVLSDSGWGSQLAPWLESILVPLGFTMEPTPFFEFDLPSYLPPIGQAGQYRFAAGLAYTGTLDFTSEISFAGFRMSAPSDSDVYVDAQAGSNANEGTFESPFKTITHALSNAEGSREAPVTIHVAAGLYANTTNGEKYPLEMKSWVSLCGDGADSTMLDGRNIAESIIRCDHVDSLTIEGFALGRASALYGRGRGIDIYGSSPRIQSNRIVSNCASGIYCSGVSSSPTINDNLICENEACGIHLEGGGSAEVIGNTISRNKVGGILCTGVRATIDNNSILNNTSEEAGGGIWCSIESDSVSITNNEIIGNSCQTLGGGIMCQFGCPLIINNTITGNSAQRGGSIFINAGSPLIVNNKIVQNSAHQGGGIWCVGRSSPRIENCTIANNTTEDWCGGVYADETCSPTIVDSILWGNGDELFGCEATYCCIEDDDPGEGNIHSDPIFNVSPSGDYYLAPESPCIDAGSRSAGEAGLSEWTTQADMFSDSGAVDLGYHHRIPKRAPTAYVEGISPNPATAGANNVLFTGYGTDEDGVIVACEWVSSLDGLLSTDMCFTKAAIELLPGSHVISFRVQDNDGLWSDPETETLVIEAHSSAPVAHIDSISPNPARQGVDAVRFVGHGEPGDRPIAAHRWRSDLDGLLSTSATFEIPAAELSARVHSITYWVRDIDGFWSEPEVAALAVERCHLYVSSETGDDSNTGSVVHPLKTITSALKLIESGQQDPVTIHVASGTYSPSTNGERFPLVMKSHVSLEGQSSDTTLLNVEGTAIVAIHCDCVQDLTIEGLTITGSKSASGKLETGAIVCLESSPTVKGNIITGSENWMGRGIYCSDSSPTIIANVIDGNHASEGGGIYCTNGAPTIRDNAITANQAWSKGGGIYCEDSSPAIENNVIRANRAASEAGICCICGDPLISGNEIADNSASGNAGGIYLVYSSATIEGNLIHGNRTPSSSSGGGIYTYGCSPLIADNLIFDNSSGHGAGIYCISSGSPSICNNTIVRNRAAHRGGGIHCTEGASPRIVDCILWDNGDELFVCSATYCCIEDLDEGEGNIHADPLFVTGPLGDYYLDPASPCIDAGSQSAAEAGLSDRTTQADGTPDTGAVDMGVHYPIP